MPTVGRASARRRSSPRRSARASNAAESHAAAAHARSRHRTPLLAIALLATLGYGALLTMEYGAGRMFPGRTLSDDFDRSTYFERGRFQPLRLTPYVDVFSEYPVLATLGFAAPFLLDARLDRETYCLVWSWLMTVPFGLTLILIHRARSGLGLSAWPIAIMLSPSILYFGLMRFDIVPAAMCCLSLYVFRRRHYALAHVLLALGVHVKWYPAVIFPVYLAYHFHQERGSLTGLSPILRSAPLRYAGIFACTVLALVAGSIAAFGWDGFLVPYRFHADRGAQYFNPYWLATMALEQVGPAARSLRAFVDAAFVAAQCSIVGVLLLRPVRSMHQVQQYAVLAVVLFVTFAKVDSPQWVLWYVPMALMFVRQRATLLALLALSLLNYLVFPLAFDALSVAGLSAVVLVKDVALVAAIWMMFALERDPLASHPPLRQARSRTRGAVRPHLSGAA
jgi:hypothetical protein